MPGSQESISCYATQSDISSGPKNQQRRSKNKSFMCVIGHQGALRTGREKENEQNIETGKCRLFFSILLCFCVSSFLRHILCTTSSHFDTNTDPTMENTVPCCWKPCPLPLLTHNNPSFLMLLYQGLLIDKVAADPPQNKCQQWRWKLQITLLIPIVWLSSGQTTLFTFSKLINHIMVQITFNTESTSVTTFIDNSVFSSVTGLVCWSFKLLHWVQHKKACRSTPHLFAT